MNRFFVITTGAVCAALSAAALILLHCSAPLKDAALCLILTLGFALLFFGCAAIERSVSSKRVRILCYMISAAFLLYKIAAAPYSPCHDALDLHNILSKLLSSRADVWDCAYMDFWINNKLTVCCYLPFVRLFGSVTAGVRFLNGALLICVIFFMSETVREITKNSYTRAVSGCGTFLALSVAAPYMLLSGPYIYLPALFLSSAAILCLNKRGPVCKILFFVCAAALFVLRPTALGCILVYLVCGAFFRIKEKRIFFRRLTAAALVIACGIAAKHALGAVMYKTGAHGYPSLNSAAALWTFELGTRDEGQDSGVCSYTPYGSDTDSDPVKREFGRLWNFYYNDELHNTNSVNQINASQSRIKKMLAERIIAEPSSARGERLLYKTENFFLNRYIPYYSRANIRSEKPDMATDHDIMYFGYMNAMLLLFFLCAIINFIKTLLKRGNEKAAALAAGAIAVNIVFILFTEVSKKYMFDFFVPMLLCISLVTADLSAKRLSAKRTCAAVCASLTAAAALFAVFGEGCAVDAFKGARTQFTEHGETAELIIDLKRPCPDEYAIITYYGRRVELYGRDSVRISFPAADFNAFSVMCPDGRIIRFSAQIIAP